MVLALLGGRVAAVDVDAGAVAVARENAARYGVAGRVALQHVEDTTRLPFADEHFDLVCANSVLEYVRADLLPGVLGELRRVTRPGGVLLVTGTSSRLWPREVHSRRWLVNWLPRRLDRWLGAPGGLQRGVLPWELTRAFPGWADLDRADRCSSYLEPKAAMGTRGIRLAVLRAAALFAGLWGVPVGRLTPSMTITLAKPG